MIIITLLTIIAVAEVLRLVLTHKKTSKKSHFKQKLEGTTKMMWDLEFKVFKTQEVREGIRKEYDYMKSRLATIEDQIKNFKGKDEDKAKLKDDKVRAEKERDRLLSQIKQIDLEVEGSNPTNQYPDGVIGIKEQIGSFYELQAMLREWIKQG